MPIQGVTVKKISDPLVAGGNVVKQLNSPDGQRVVYSADQETNNVFELYTTSNEERLYLPFTQRN